MSRRRFKLFRYRRPSLNNLLGVTRVKRRALRASGITALLRPFRAPGNFVRKVKRHTGYYPIARFLRGQYPTFLGLGSGGGSQSSSASLGCAGASLGVGVLIGVPVFLVVAALHALAAFFAPSTPVRTAVAPPAPVVRVPAPRPAMSPETMRLIARKQAEYQAWVAEHERKRSASQQAAARPAPVPQAAPQFSYPSGGFPPQTTAAPAAPAEDPAPPAEPEWQRVPSPGYADPLASNPDAVHYDRSTGEVYNPVQPAPADGQAGYGASASYGGGYAGGYSASYGGSRGRGLPGTDVPVRGYTRANGTYVSPYTRAAPGFGRGRR